MFGKMKRWLRAGGLAWLLFSLCVHPAYAQSGPQPDDGHWFVLPDLITLPPTEINIRENAATGVRSLRFSNHIANQGRGSLEIIGKDDRQSLTTVVTQKIKTIDGGVADWVAGTFVFHPAHNHYHMEDFARYELWSLTPSGELQAIAALSEKVSYCLRDNVRLEGYASPPRATYYICGKVAQGISPGWVDTYPYFLPGQSLDITGLPDGIYALYAVVDPFNLLLELDESNNDVLIYLEITGRKVRQLPGASVLFRLGESYASPH